MGESGVCFGAAAVAAATIEWKQCALKHPPVAAAAAVMVSAHMCMSVCWRGAYYSLQGPVVVSRKHTDALSFSPFSSVGRSVAIY